MRSVRLVPAGVVLLTLGALSAVAQLAYPAVPGPDATGPGPADRVELTALPPVGVPLRPVGPVRASSPGVLSVLTLPAGSSTGKQGTSVAEGWSVSASGTMA